MHRVPTQEKSNIAMFDPFLALSFDPYGNAYEKASDSLIADLGAGKLTWIFASYKDPEQSGPQYIVLAGLVPDYSHGVQPVMPLVVNTGGIFVNVDKKFQFVDYPLFMDARDLPERVTTGLSRDFVARLIKAYGGKEEVKKKIALEWFRFFGGGLRPSLLRSQKRSGKRASRMRVP